MSDDLISIITPSFNSATYIGSTIQSVINQTYKHWELLITDDCSTDETINVIHEYMKLDSRIRLFSTSHNTGTPAEPRNISIANARGRYLAFLDSDDIWLPSKLEEQIGFVKLHNYVFVYSDYNKFCSVAVENERIIRGPEKVCYRDLLKTCNIPCLTVMCEAELFSSLRFLAIAKEDYAMWLDILKRGIVAYNTGKVHALYRESPGSRSSNKFQMLFNQWYIVRKREHINFFRACIYMFIYAIAGIRKYRV